MTVSSSALLFPDRPSAALNTHKPLARAATLTRVMRPFPASPHPSPLPSAQGPNQVSEHSSALPPPNAQSNLLSLSGMPRPFLPLTTPPMPSATSWLSEPPGIIDSHHDERTPPSSFSCSLLLSTSFTNPQTPSSFATRRAR